MTVLLAIEAVSLITRRILMTILVTALTLFCLRKLLSNLAITFYFLKDSALRLLAVVIVFKRL